MNKCFDLFVLLTLLHSFCLSPLCLSLSLSPLKPNLANEHLTCLVKLITDSRESKGSALASWKTRRWYLLLSVANQDLPLFLPRELPFYSSPQRQNNAIQLYTEEQKAPPPPLFGGENRHQNQRKFLIILPDYNYW